MLNFQPLENLATKRVLSLSATVLLSLTLVACGGGGGGGGERVVDNTPPPPMMDDSNGAPTPPMMDDDGETPPMMEEPPVVVMPPEEDDDEMDEDPGIAATVAKLSSTGTFIRTGMFTEAELTHLDGNHTVTIFDNTTGLFASIIGDGQTAEDEFFLGRRTIVSRYIPESNVFCYSDNGIFDTQFANSGIRVNLVNDAVDANLLIENVLMRNCDINDYQDLVNTFETIEIQSSLFTRDAIDGSRAAVNFTIPILEDQNAFDPFTDIGLDALNGEPFVGYLDVFRMTDLAFDGVASQDGNFIILPKEAAGENVSSFFTNIIIAQDTTNFAAFNLTTVGLSELFPRGIQSDVAVIFQ